jgi:hypothetical protein
VSIIYAIGFKVIPSAAHGADVDSNLYVDALSDTLGDNAEIFEDVQASFHAVTILLVYGRCVNVDFGAAYSPTSRFVPR